ncbi:MAG: hypothetical protein ACRDLZ_01810 [Gaiellaceae bacterium]
MQTGASFRELRWRRFEHAFEAWLATPEGRFAEFCARREREEADRRALLRRVALASSVLPANCVGCALRLALVSRAGTAGRVLDELLTGHR